MTGRIGWPRQPWPRGTHPLYLDSIGSARSRLPLHAWLSLTEWNNNNNESIFFFSFKAWKRENSALMSLCEVRGGPVGLLNYSIGWHKIQFPSAEWNMQKHITEAFFCVCGAVRCINDGRTHPLTRQAQLPRASGWTHGTLPGRKGSTTTTTTTVSTLKLSPPNYSWV